MTVQEYRQTTVNVECWRQTRTVCTVKLSNVNWTGWDFWAETLSRKTQEVVVGVYAKVAIGYLITSVGNFFENPEDIDSLCIFQGLRLVHYTMKWLKDMHIIIWSIMAVCTILPLTTDSYGSVGSKQHTMRLCIIWANTCNITWHATK